MGQTPERASKRYPSDLSNEEWAVLRRYIPAPKAVPNPWKYERREVVNAIRYKLRTGCGWEYLPRDLPPWKTFSAYFYRWRDDRTWGRLVTAPRRRAPRPIPRSA